MTEESACSSINSEDISDVTSTVTRFSSWQNAKRTRKIHEDKLFCDQLLLHFYSRFHSETWPKYLF